MMKVTIDLFLNQFSVCNFHSNNILNQFIEAGVFVRKTGSEFKLTDFKKEFKYWADSNEKNDEAAGLLKKVKLFASAMHAEGLAKVLVWGLKNASFDHKELARTLS